MSKRIRTAFAKHDNGVATMRCGWVGHTHEVGLSRGFLPLLLLPPWAFGVGPRTAAHECTLERASVLLVLAVCRHIEHPKALPRAQERKLVASMAGHDTKRWCASAMRDYGTTPQI